MITHTLLFLFAYPIYDDCLLRHRDKRNGLTYPALERKYRSINCRILAFIDLQAYKRVNKH